MDEVKTLQIMVVVDTASLPEAPGSSPDSPKDFGHAQAFMITEGGYCDPASNGTADLLLKNLRVQDSLQVWGTSLSNQLQDEIFIYDFKHSSGDTVLDSKGLQTLPFKEDAMAPVEGGPSHKPPTVNPESRTFYSNEIAILGRGTERFLVDFVVYGPVPRGTGERAVKGYYRWDPSVTAR